MYYVCYKRTLLSSPPSSRHSRWPASKSRNLSWVFISLTKMYIAYLKHILVHILREKSVCSWWLYFFFIKGSAFAQNTCWEVAGMSQDMAERAAGPPLFLLQSSLCLHCVQKQLTHFKHGALSKAVAKFAQFTSMCMMSLIKNFSMWQCRKRV